MHEKMRPKFNFVYKVDNMVTDGLFIDTNKDKVAEDIAERIKTWYTENLHEKITQKGITISSVVEWITVMGKVDIETTCKNNKQYDLVDANMFDQAVLKYIDHSPLGVKDLYYFMIY